MQSRKGIKKNKDFIKFFICSKNRFKQQLSVSSGTTRNATHIINSAIYTAPVRLRPNFGPKEPENDKETILKK